MLLKIILVQILTQKYATIGTVTIGTLVTVVSTTQMTVNLLDIM